MIASNKVIFLLLVSLSITSCRERRNLVYFSNLNYNENYSTAIVNTIEPTIEPGDILEITVSSLNAESNNLFNGRPVTGNTAPIDKDPILEGYLVDKSGTINLPVIGRLEAGGITIDVLRQKLTTLIEAYIKNPIVNVRFFNFRVTVVGEVNRPGTFTVTNNRISVIEALGQAGDMTAYGKRENVLILREMNGRRSVTRINLNDKAILSSPFFYLKQNDVVYIEPDKAKAVQVTGNDRWLPVIVSAASIIAIIATRK